jgi:predicted glycosyltransferase
MSAEAGVLGTPYVRFNDFVGKLGYLEELENKYKLGFGFTSNQSDRMIEKVKELINEDKNVYDKYRENMLRDKINVAEYLYDYLINQKYFK